jgi:hypothetical protein
MKKISLLTALFLLVSISSCSDNESTQDQVLRLFSCYVNGIKRGSTNNSTAGYRNLNLTILQKNLQQHTTTSITSDTSIGLLDGRGFSIHCSVMVYI